jgi:hypothetical protein
MSILFLCDRIGIGKKHLHLKLEKEDSPKCQHYLQQRQETLGSHGHVALRIEIERW